MRAIASLRRSGGVVLDMEASSEAKFSRHLIFKLPGVAFASNLDMGACTTFVPQSFSSERARFAVQNPLNAN